MIKPFDPTTIKVIERAIQASELGLNPNNDGKVIHLNLPPLTEERRRDLVKHVASPSGRVPRSNSKHPPRYA